MLRAGQERTRVRVLRKEVGSRTLQVEGRNSIWKIGLPQKLLSRQRNQSPFVHAWPAFALDIELLQFWAFWDLAGPQYLQNTNTKSPGCF